MTKREQLIRDTIASTNPTIFGVLLVIQQYRQRTGITTQSNMKVEDIELLRPVYEVAKVYVQDNLDGIEIGDTDDYFAMLSDNEQIFNFS